MEVQLHPSMNREGVSPLSIPQNPLMHCRKERKKKLICSMKREYYSKVLVIFYLILICQPAVVVFHIILICQPLLCFASLLSPELFYYGYFELQGLGKLAEKFPNIACTSIYCLRDFLVTPSRILLTLRQQCGYADRDALQRLKITGMVLFLQR